jgi:hypothetical protein
VPPKPLAEQRAPHHIKTILTKPRLYDRSQHRIPEYIKIGGTAPTTGRWPISDQALARARAVIASSNSSHQAADGLELELLDVLDIHTKNRHRQRRTYRVRLRTDDGAHRPPFTIDVEPKRINPHADFMTSSNQRQKSDVDAHGTGTGHAYHIELRAGRPTTADMHALAEKLLARFPDELADYPLIIPEVP